MKMDPLMVAKLLFLALNIAQQEAPVIQEAIETHWGKDHLQQAIKGTQLLSKALNTAAGNFSKDPELAEPSAEMGEAPPAPTAAKA